MMQPSAWAMSHWKGWSSGCVDRMTNMASLRASCTTQLRLARPASLRTRPRYQPVSFSIAPGMGYSSTSVVSNGKNCDKIRLQLVIDYARYARWIASDNAGHIQSLLMEVGREHLSRASTLLEEPLQIPCSSHPS
jgi:hypothetical protein